MRTAARARVIPSALAALLAIPSLAGSEDCNRNGVPDDRDVLPVHFGLARGATLFADPEFTHMAAGDLDGDGRDDIATAAFLHAQVHLASQDGGFQEPVAFAVQDPIHITAADLDRDGTEELLLIQGAGRSVLVLALERAFESVLSTLASIPIAGPPYPLTVHDFDADGDLDLAVGSIAGGDDFQVQLFIQEGLSFDDVPVSGVGPAFLLIGSLDADIDGRADLITVKRSRGETPALAVHRNDGSGSFSPLLVPAVEPLGAHPGDFDGDGDPDLLIEGLAGFDMLINDAASRSFRRGIQVGGPLFVPPVAEDLDGDGDLDVAARDGGRIWIALNSGDATFEVAPAVGARDLRSAGPPLVAGDFDGDRDVDLAIGKYGYPRPSPVLVLENRPVPLSLDCNRDGIPDECVPGIAPTCDDCDSNGIPDAEEIASGVADSNENGVPDRCEAGFDIRFGFRAPFLAVGSAGTPLRVPASIEARTLGLERGEPGPTGWFIRMRADGGRFTDATTEGTLAGPPPDGLRSRGFSSIELPGETSCGEDVMESAVVLGLQEIVSLPQRSSEVLRLGVEVTPGREERTCSLEFQIDCYRPPIADGAGADHPTWVMVTWEGDSLTPSFDAMPPMRIVALEFIRGDVNHDSKVDISDAIRGFMFLFLGASAPACLDTNDANDDGQVDITDGIHILSDFFIEGTAIPAPGPFECGIDPTGDRVSCGAYAFCD